MKYNGYLLRQTTCLSEKTHQQDIWLFQLLFGCYIAVVSVNEVLRLKMEDVDLMGGIITVYNGKGGKDRFVPVHDSIVEYLANYSAQLPEAREWFFPSAYGHYSSNTIYENFRELLFLSGIPHTAAYPDGAVIPEIPAGFPICPYYAIRAHVCGPYLGKTIIRRI